MPDAAVTPVIVGVGEIKDQPQDRAAGQEPAALIEAALRRAEEDAGAALLRRMDSLDVVNVISWPYDDLPTLLADRLGAAPTWRRHGEIGGQTPVQFLHEAASRIARGQSTIAAVCGGEASHTATWARRTKTDLGWTKPRATPQSGPGWLPARNRDYIHPLARHHGLTEPIAVYPLYENATQARWQQTPPEAQAESAALWSALSQVAAQNPTAWLPTPLTPEAIATPGPANRMIAWPYPKLMVANPAVNQAAAILLTSLATARAAGIPDHRLIYLHAAASAAEPRDWMARPRLDHCPAQTTVLEAMRRALNDNPPEALELYTCFPVVPKMARRILGLPPNTPISVTGGLTFHGAPFNSTMTHAAAMMVRTLRTGAGSSRGLLYGQGGHLTTHHALLLGQAPGTPPHPTPLTAASPEPTPTIATDPEGPAHLETFTILFNPDGAIAHGTVILRLPAGARTLATVPPEDTETLALLMRPDQTPLGTHGRITPGPHGTPNGLHRWTATIR